MQRKIALAVFPLVLMVWMLDAKWRSDHPALTNGDVSLRRSLPAVTSINISYFNHPNAFTLRDEEAAEFIEALRVQDETTREPTSNNGPSTDFMVHRKGKEDLWVTLRPGKTYNDWWLKLDENGSLFMRVHPVTIRYLEGLFRDRGHKLVWS